MIHDRSNEGRVVRMDWRHFRDIARRTAQSAEEFSEQDQERYNLDWDDRVASARISGESNPDSYSGASAEGIEPHGPVDTDDDPIR